MLGFDWLDRLQDPSLPVSRMADKSRVGTRKQGFIMTGNQLISQERHPCGNLGSCLFFFLIP